MSGPQTFKVVLLGEGTSPPWHSGFLAHPGPWPNSRGAPSRSDASASQCTCRVPFRLPCHHLYGHDVVVHRVPRHPPNPGIDLDLDLWRCRAGREDIAGTEIRAKHLQRRAARHHPGLLPHQAPDGGEQNHQPRHLGAWGLALLAPAMAVCLWLVVRNAMPRVAVHASSRHIRIPSSHQLVPKGFCAPCPVTRTDWMEGAHADCSDNSVTRLSYSTQLGVVVGRQRTARHIPYTSWQLMAVQSYNHAALSGTPRWALELSADPSSLYRRERRGCGLWRASTLADVAELRWCGRFAGHGRAGTLRRARTHLLPRR